MIGKGILSQTLSVPALEVAALADSPPQSHPAVPAIRREGMAEQAKVGDRSLYFSCRSR